VKESQSTKATCRKYTIGKGPISVGDAQKLVAKKVAQRKLKKQVQVDTQFIIPVGNNDDDIGRVDDKDINLEL
jgi:hypothetical protein